MLYIVNFDIKDSARAEQFAQQLSEVGETLLFMPRCYFLKTNESVSGMSIYNKLKSVLKDEDLFVLAPVKVADMNGWLATSTVTWLSNQEYNTFFHCHSQDDAELFASVEEMMAL